MRKIVVLDGRTENPGDLSWDALGQHGHLTVYDRTEDADIITRIGDASIIYTNKTPITKEIIDACPQIEFIGVLVTDNVVDTEYAKQKGIPVAMSRLTEQRPWPKFVFALLLKSVTMSAS